MLLLLLLLAFSRLALVDDITSKECAAANVCQTGRYSAALP